MRTRASIVYENARALLSFGGNLARVRRFRRFMKLSPLTFGCSVLLLAALSGCTELRGRSHARKGNQLYVDGNYAAALAEYSEAERLMPSFPTVLLNKGLACRQMMLPGVKSAENDRAVTCALAAFEKLKQVTPQDPRGEQLYVQTLFDADRFEILAARYEQQLKENPKDLAALNGLIQVYLRWDRWNDALRLSIRRAEMQSQDAEAQYSVGVLVWSRLFQKGGAAEKAAFNPSAEPKQVPPPWGDGDIQGEERVNLANQGISYLEKAIALRPKYREAMTYLNLLYRQKSYAFFDHAEDFQASTKSAEEWRARAVALDTDHHKAAKP